MIHPTEPRTSDQLRQKPHYIRHMWAARVLFPLAALLFLAMSASSWIAMVEFIWHCWPNWTLISRVIFRYQLVLGLPIFLVFGLLFLTYCVYREVWVLRADSLTRFGVFRTSRISWDEATTLDWWPFQRMIVLRSANTRISLFMDSLKPQQRLQFIRYLHQAIPIEKQRNWPRFCHHMAVPLQQRLEASRQTTGSDHAHPKRLTPQESLTLWNQTHASQQN